MTWQHDFTLSQHNSCDLHLNNKFLSWMISNKLLSRLISNKFLSQSISSKLLSQLISNKSFNQSISYFSTLSAWISNLFSSSTSVKFKKFSQLNNCIYKVICQKNCLHSFFCILNYLLLTYLFFDWIATLLLSLLLSLKHSDYITYFLIQHSIMKNIIQNLCYFYFDYFRKADMTFTKASFVIMLYHLRHVINEHQKLTIYLNLLSTMQKHHEMI